MRRFLALIVTSFVIVSCLVSCGGEPVFVKYNDDDIGLHYELPSSMEIYKYGSAGTYKNYRNQDGTVAVVISYLTNKGLAENEAPYGADVNLEDFLNHFIDSEGLEGMVEIDYNDDKTRATCDLSVTDPNTELGQYYYYTWIRNENGICVVQMFCHIGLMKTYAPQFSRWSDYIYTY